MKFQGYPFRFPTRSQSKSKAIVFEQRPSVPLTGGTYLLYRYDPAGGACIGRGQVIKVTPVTDFGDGKQLVVVENHDA